MVCRARAPALGGPPSWRPSLAPPPARLLSWLGHMTGVQGFSIYDSTRVPPVPCQGGKTLPLHLQVGLSVTGATNEWRVCVCFPWQGGLWEPPGTPMQPQVPQGPSLLPAGSARRAGDGLSTEGQAGLRADRGGQRLPSLPLSCCPVLFLRRSFPPSFCKERAPVGVTSLPTFSPEEDPPSPPSSAYSGACHATLFTAINEECKVRVMGSGNLP